MAAQTVCSPVICQRKQHFYKLNSVTLLNIERSWAFFFLICNTIILLLCFQVYGLPWLVILAVMIVLKVRLKLHVIIQNENDMIPVIGSKHWCTFNLQIVSMGRKKFSADFQLMFRLLKLFLFAGCIVIIAMLFYFLDLTVGDIFQSLLAFMPTGWAILQVLGLFLEALLSL